MSATIFCTFDQQDLADLAMGRLRSGVSGIHSIQYLTDFREQHREHGDYGGFLMGWLPAMNYHNGPGVQPSHPVSVKIVCDDAVRETVVGKLVNLHAYKIVAS